MQWHKIAGLALGMLTAVGGFVDIGGIITSMQAGAQFRFALLWTLVPGIVGAIVYTEMSGRIALASGRAAFDVIRERLGYKLALIPLVAAVIANLLTLVAELAGMALVFEFASRVSYLLWFPIVALFLWIVLWKASFDLMDQGTALLGLATFVFVAAMVALHPPVGEIGKELILPQIGGSSVAAYLFMIVSLLGANMTPYQFYFYSSGVIEERWGGEDFTLNRASSIIGTAFGGIVAFGIMVVAAMALYPQGMRNPDLRSLGEAVSGPFGVVGWVLFLVGTFAVSMGAGLESALSTAYSVAQYFGFDWGKRFRPKAAPVFSLVYTAMIPLAVLIALTGVDPIQLTLWAMAIAAFSLPFSFGPLLIVANDQEYMGEQQNSRAINAVAIFLLLLLSIITVVTIPLLIINIGGG